MYCYSIVSYYLIRLVLNVFRSVSINHMSNSLPIRFRAIQVVSVGLWIHSIYVCPSCMHIRLTPYRISSRTKEKNNSFHQARLTTNERVQEQTYSQSDRLVAFYLLRNMYRRLDFLKIRLRIQLMNLRLDW